MPHSQKLFVWDFSSLRIKYGLKCFAMSKKIQTKDSLFSKESLKRYNKASNH